MSRTVELTVERVSVLHPRNVGRRFSVRITSHSDALPVRSVHVARKIVLVTELRNSYTNNSTVQRTYTTTGSICHVSM